MKKYLLAKYGKNNHANVRVVACVGCGTELNYRTLTVDRYPILGRDGGTYCKENVRPMCAPCNNNHLHESAP